MPDFSIEHRFAGRACGIDEVGRGPLAGPVFAACVFIPQDLWGHPLWAQINDSKKLSAAKRAQYAGAIRALVPFGLGHASVDEIDTHNILQATFIAMTRAYHEMIGSSDHLIIPSSAHLTALIDGNRTPKNFPIPTQTVIKGDQISASIAAASIIAKVARDAVMATLARDYPAYGWDGNAGYGTPAHLAALAKHGPCPHHRTSFAPIKSYKN